MLLKEYLEQNKISYRQFAQSVGVSTAYLSELINGKREHISEELANRIAEKHPQVDIFKEVTYKYKIRSDK